MGEMEESRANWWHSREAQWAEDPSLSLQWLKSLLWCGFSPYPGNVHMLQVQPKKKERENDPKVSMSSRRRESAMNFKL